MTTLEILGEVRELPIAVESAPELARFEDFLVQRSELSEAEARTLTGTLVASLIEGVANRAGAEMRTHLQAIVSLRAELRTRFEQMRRIFHGTAPGIAELPPELQPEALRDLFGQLGDHLDALRDPAAKAIDAYHNPENLVPLDILTADTEDAGPQDRPRSSPGTYEQQRVELDLYRERERYLAALEAADPEIREAVRDDPELDSRLELFADSVDPRARASAEVSLRIFAARFGIPENWKVGLRQIPLAGFTLEQIRMLASRDASFAGHGFEVTITVPEGVEPWATGPRGASFAPDGVMQRPQGYLFLEYKGSWAEDQPGVYPGEQWRAGVRADMVRRAQMSMELPGCGGWGYKTGRPWLDDAIVGVLDDLRRDEPELAARIHMLEYE